MQVDSEMRNIDDASSEITNDIMGTCLSLIQVITTLQWDLVTIQIYSNGIIWTISSASWTLEFGI